MWSKEDRAAYMREWREKNKEKVKEYRHNYYCKSLLNGLYEPPSAEVVRKYCKSWRDNNREKYREYQREYQRKRRKTLLTNAKKCDNITIDTP